MVSCLFSSAYKLGHDLTLIYCHDLEIGFVQGSGMGQPDGAVGAVASACPAEGIVQSKDKADSSRELDEQTCNRICLGCLRPLLLAMKNCDTKSQATQSRKAQGFMSDAPTQFAFASLMLEVHDRLVRMHGRIRSGGRIQSKTGMQQCHSQSSPFKV